MRFKQKVVHWFDAGTYSARMTRERTLGTRKMVSLPDDMWQQIDDYRFSNRIHTEAEAIRRLIRAGLDLDAAADEELYADLVRLGADPDAVQRYRARVEANLELHRKKRSS